MKKLSISCYQTEEDYWRIREFLRHVMNLNQRRDLSWHVARLDYWWWFINRDLEKLPLAENVFIWKTANGEIAAVLNPEGRGQAFAQVHPGFITPALCAEMVVFAEEHLSTTDENGRQKVWFFIQKQDKNFSEILTRHGFQRVTRDGAQEIQHRRSLEGTLPEVPAVAGYTIRPLGDGLELLERCYASGLGFHDDDIHIARDNRDFPGWYHHIQTAPLYRRDLDLVAVASDGSIASFCTAWFDDVTRTAYLEPVATIPKHQRRGLGKAVLMTVLHRLQKMGCKVAFVGGYSSAANALYFSVMGTEHDISEPWEKFI
jgi:mycothiol synthase